MGECGYLKYNNFLFFVFEWGSSKKGEGASILTPVQFFVLNDFGGEVYIENAQIFQNNRLEVENTS